MSSMKRRAGQKAKLVLPDVQQDLPKIITAKFEHGHLKTGLWKDLEYSYEQSSSNKDGSDGLQKSLKIMAKKNVSYLGHCLKPADLRGPRYYIGCLNRQTGKMSIHDMEMFQLKPSFQGEEQASKPDFDGDLTYSEKVERLHAAFGSARKKRAINSRWKFNEEYGEHYNDALDKSIDHAVSLGDVSATPDRPAEHAESSILPPQNRDAEHAEDVYTFAHMLSSQALTALKTPAEKFVKRTKDELKEWTNNQVYPEYILEELEVLPAEETSRWEKAKHLMYLHYLLSLFKLKPADLKKPNCLPTDWPEAVKKDLLQQFTMTSDSDTGRRKIRYFPARLKDKLLMYILAMSLILGNGRFNPTVLTRDLAVPERKISQFYRALGCTVTSKRTTMRNPDRDGPTVVLKLPLKTAASLSRAKKSKAKQNLRS